MATQPVLCKGVDSSNNVIALRTDTNGKLELSSTTLSVSGTVSVSNQGQAVMASSVPVVIASDQSAITVSSTQSAASSSDSLSILAGGTDISVKKDTAGYSKVGIVVTSDQVDTTVQLKWSHDDVTYYPVEEPSATASVTEIGGGANVNSLYFIVSPIAKWVRLDVNAVTAATVKALVNLH